MKTKKLQDLLVPQEFEKLLGFVLLFDKDSEYFKFSGFVTAALLDFEGTKEEPLTILAINGQHGLITFHRTRKDLHDMFNNCVEFVGRNEEESFVLEK